VNAASVQLFGVALHASDFERKPIPSVRPRDGKKPSTLKSCWADLFLGKHGVYTYLRIYVKRIIPERVVCGTGERQAVTRCPSVLASMKFRLRFWNEHGRVKDSRGFGWTLQKFRLRSQACLHLLRIRTSSVSAARGTFHDTRGGHHKADRG